MLGKIAAVLVPVASCLVIGGSLPAADAGTNPASHHSTRASRHSAAAENSPWWDTNADAAQNRSNLEETVLSPSALPNAGYLRSVVSPPSSPTQYCGPANAGSPVLTGNYMYALTNNELSKYNAATGALLWRADPNQAYVYYSVDITQDLIIVAGTACGEVSQPASVVYAYKAGTSALAWSDSGSVDVSLIGAVQQSSYVVISGTNVNGPGVQVFDLSNGHSVWSSYGCGGPPAPGPSPLVVGAMVIDQGCTSGGGNSIQASNLATGATVWTDNGNWTPQIGDQAGQHLFVADAAGTVEDLSPANGEIEYDLSGAVTAVAVDTSRVYASCGTRGADVCAYNVNTGALDWEDTDLAASIAGEADGVLYLNSGVALNAATGATITTLWSGTSSAFAVGDGRIAVIADPRVIDLYGLAGY